MQTNTGTYVKAYAQADASSRRMLLLNWFGVGVNLSVQLLKKFFLHLDYIPFKSII